MITMTSSIKIDFVSDISCPWCAVGWQSLRAALKRLPEIKVDVFFQPFELNPDMKPGGQDAVEHLKEKLHITPEQLEQSQATLVARGAEHGFVFDMQKRTRVYNTFDAHRLLHWANHHGSNHQGKQRELKQALFVAYFTGGRDVSNHEVLIDLVTQSGLDAVRAKQILSSNECANDVREREQFYTSHGIHGVPAIIVNDRHLIEGAQPVEVFERVLRQIATETR
jgi:predicted DsbA family dithiol-disulfide isomerase